MKVPAKPNIRAFNVDLCIDESNYSRKWEVNYYKRAKEKLLKLANNAAKCGHVVEVVYYHKPIDCGRQCERHVNDPRRDGGYYATMAEHRVLDELYPRIYYTEIKWVSYLKINIRKGTNDDE